MKTCNSPASGATSLQICISADPSLKGSAPRSLIEYYCRDEERVIWASILLLFRCFGSVSPSHSLQRFSIGFSIVFQLRTKDCFPSAFRSYFAWFGHRSFSSFLMRSLGDVRQFSGLCFVWFGHQSCCCSSVSQLRTKDCFPSAFRSYFAWFGHRSC